MCVDGVFEFLCIKINDENTMRCWQRQQVTCCAAAYASRAASDDDILALGGWHAVWYVPEKAESRLEMGLYYRRSRSTSYTFPLTPFALSFRWWRVRCGIDNVEQQRGLPFSLFYQLVQPQNRSRRAATPYRYKEHVCKIGSWVFGTAAPNHWVRPCTSWNQARASVESEA